MKTQIWIRMLIILVFGGIFSGCDQLEQAQKLYATATAGMEKVATMTSDLNMKAEELDSLLARAEAREPELLAKLDANMDGKLSEAELKSPGMLGLILSTYKKDGFMGVLALLIAAFALFQGNHIFEWRKKLKQYGGGFLKRISGFSDKE